MKKIIVGGLLALMLPLAASAQTFDQNLYFGIQGDSEVKQLQEFLTDQGIYSGPISGNFFSLTLAGVKNFQSREGIIPASGYFGPLTRARASDILSQQLGPSDQQAIVETGTSTPPVQASSTIQLQLDALLKQVALMQAQLQAQQSSTQAIQGLQAQVQQQTQTIQQQAQTLQQIQQNTTPSTPPATPVVIPVKKEITFQSERRLSKYQGVVHIFRVYYSEDGIRKANFPISMSVDDSGAWLVAEGKVFEQSPAQTLTRSGVADNGTPGENFTYSPKTEEDKIITFQVNDTITTTSVSGQLPLDKWPTE